MGVPPLRKMYTPGEAGSTGRSSKCTPQDRGEPPTGTVTRPYTRAMSAPHLFLVRHGQTAGNVTQTLGQDPDTPLDPAGEAQARAVAAWFAALKLPSPRVYASAYRRATQTGAAIAGELRVPLTVLEGLQEFGVGDWAGRPYAHLHTHLHEWVHEDGTPGFPGGESLRGVAQRVQAALEGALLPHTTPIVISHGGALSALLAALLGTDPTQAWQEGRFTHRNTAVTHLTREQGRWHLLQLAQTQHLPHFSQA